MADLRLLAYRERWNGKAVLRAVYSDYYRRIAEYCIPGRTLELGGGCGNFKDSIPAVVSTDVLEAPWLDAVADAHALPFAAASFDNMVMVDVLHHLARPRVFLDEAVRVLKPGGRLIVLEPNIALVSGIFYRLFHEEPVDMRADPLGAAPLSDPADPYASNQAVLTLLLGKYRQRLAETFPALVLIAERRLSYFAYPLSGGLKRWSLIPRSAVSPLLRIEGMLEPFVGGIVGFRLLAVFGRVAPSNLADRW